MYELSREWLYAHPSNAGSWSSATAHNRAQVLYYLAENLDARRGEFVARIIDSTGVSEKKARDEFDASLRRISNYALQADKSDGAVHSAESRPVTLAINERWDSSVSFVLMRRRSSRWCRWRCRQSPWAITSWLSRRRAIH
jgi:acyl-CoA reductase-like NAD-dependent aldehyde dehydrogenase